MDEQHRLNYITRGKRWARGWNKYEARTMSWLRGILIAALVLGVVAGISVGIMSDFSPLLMLLAIVGVGLVALIVGVAIAKVVIPFIWETMLTKDLEV